MSLELDLSLCVGWWKCGKQTGMRRAGDILRCAFQLFVRVEGGLLYASGLSSQCKKPLKLDAIRYWLLPRSRLVLTPSFDHTTWQEGLLYTQTVQHPARAGAYLSLQRLRPDNTDPIQG